MTTATTGVLLAPASRRPRRWLFVSPGRWQAATFFSVLAALLLFPLYADDTLWLGAGVVAISLIAWHSLVMARRIPWIPGLALATAALQWVIAPWISYHIGASYQLFTMVVSPSQYFGYAVPALVVLATGMLGVLRATGRGPAPESHGSGAATRQFRRTCDAMVVVGIVVQLMVARLLGAGSLAFIAVLVGNLGFVGALALLIARAPAWWLRVAAVLGTQALVSAANGMFHDLVLWSAYFCLTIIYVYRLRARTIALLLAGGMAAIMVLNVVKREFRQSLETTQEGLLGRAAMLGTTMLDNGSDLDFAYEGDGLKANVTRLNQGWIIARVLYWVPSREPYAHGETIGATIRATLLPRVLDPNKLSIGGQTYFERFTGLPLGRASMDLSLAGEMYANYGYWGGLLGILVFGALIGIIYRVFLRWAYHSPLWWAWAPFVLLYSSKAENSIAEVTNHVAKSWIVVVAVIALVPAWATLRRSLRARLARAVRFLDLRTARPPASPGR